MAENRLTKILIVDDETAQMKALCNTLSDHGYETTGFASAQAALAAMDSARFELLLTDLMMPEMDGITLLKSALQKDPDLVGILMTGEGTIAKAVEAMKSGALDFILKPFRLSVILPVLERALSVQRLRRENAVLERRIMDRTAELERANEELEAFSYSVSHDLRAPLRAVDGYSQAIMEDFGTQLPPEGQRYLQSISKGVRRMGLLIDDLLTFSHLGRQPLEKREVDTDALVDEVLAELNPQSASRRVEIRREELPPCQSDPALLKQVWINLLSNALKYSSKRDPAIIEIGCRREAENIYFVRDNGAGFDLAHAAKLFGVFQRFHRADEFEGTGVGLAIVQRIVQRHGGRIWAEAKPDHGAAFYFTLDGTPTA